jgi:hypothetical protein
MKEADVEPDRRVESRKLVDENHLQLGLEGLGLFVTCEVAALTAPGADRRDNAPDHLLDAPLPIGCAHLAAEVLLGDDVGRGLRPEARELNALLLEGRPLLAGDEGVAHLPLDLVEGIAPGNSEVSAHAETRLRVDHDVFQLLVRRLNRCLFGCRHLASPSLKRTPGELQRPAGHPILRAIDRRTSER